MTRLRDRRFVRELPIVVVLLLGAVGLLLIDGDRWRKGSAVLAISSLLGAVLRLTVREDWVGVLAVRGKKFDVAFLVVGAGILGTLSIGL